MSAPGAPGAGPVRTLPEVLGDALLDAPDGLAVVTDDLSLTRRQLDLASYRVARACVAAGISPGEPLVVVVPLDVCGVVGMLGAVRSGAAITGLDPAIPGPARVGIVHRLGTRVAVVTAEHARWATSIGLEPVVVDDLDRLCEERPAEVRPPLPAPRPGMRATVTFTSGSSGRPKGVVRLVPPRAPSLAHGASVLPGNVALVTPFGPAPSMLALAAAIGTHAAVCPFDVRAHPTAELADFLERHGVTSLRTSGSHFRSFLAALGDRRLPTLREVLVGADAMFAADVEAFRRLGHRDACIRYLFGLSETTELASVIYRNDGPPPHDPLVFPHLSPNLRVTVERPDGTPVPGGEVGEIVARGPVLAVGYLDDPELESARFFVDPDGTRGFRTGDLGRFTEDGALEVVGRNDDQVTVRGSNVHLSVVEGHVRGLPGVHECAVVAVDDGRGGTRLAGLVVPTTGAAPSAGELRRALGAVLPAHMVPTFVTVDQLPRLASGKLDRSGARAIATAARPATDGAPFVVTPAERAIGGIFLRVLDVPPGGWVTPDQDFFEAGGDSLRALELLALLHDDLGLTLDVADLMEHSTPAALAALVGGQGVPGSGPFLAVGAAGTGAGTGGGTSAGTGADAGTDVGTATPIVLYPGAADSALHLQPLARRLGRPVLVRRGRGVDDPRPPKVALRRLLSEELALLRAAQPHGPYLLGGHSLGGVLALELARRLRRAGETVELVVLLDSRFPPDPWDRLSSRIAARGQGVPGGRRATVADWADALRRVALRRLRALRRSPAAATPAAPAGGPGATGPMGSPDHDAARRAAVLARREEVRRAVLQSVTWLRVRPYDGDVVSVLATKSDLARPEVDPWEPLIRGCRTVLLSPGDHSTLIEHPLVEDLAAQLRPVLDAADAAYAARAGLAARTAG